MRGTREALITKHYNYENQCAVQDTIKNACSFGNGASCFKRRFHLRYQIDIEKAY